MFCIAEADLAFVCSFNHQHGKYYFAAVVLSGDGRGGEAGGGGVDGEVEETDGGASEVG